MLAPNRGSAMTHLPMGIQPPSTLPTMKELVILGAGKIGRMVCHFMSHAKDESAPTYSFLMWSIAPCAASPIRTE